MTGKTFLSRLCKGDPYFTLSQVALNDAIMVVAFAPIVALLLGLSSITGPWDTLLTSVALYIVVPVIIAQAWRKVLPSLAGATGASVVEAPNAGIADVVRASEAVVDRPEYGFRR